MCIIQLLYLCAKLAADPATPTRYPHFNDFVKTLPASKGTSLPAAPPEPQVDLTEANKQLRQRQRMAEMQRAQIMKAPPEPQLDLTEVNRQLAAKRKALKAAPATVPTTQPAYDPKAPYISSKFARPKGYYNLDQVFEAIRKGGEGWRNRDAKYGDYKNGKPMSIGLYQIQWPYAYDAGHKDVWPNGVKNKEIAEQVIIDYMKRYIPEYIPKDRKAWLSQKAIEYITKIHNGGPRALKATGKKRENVTSYYNRVNKYLKDVFGE